jgi:hypothetical protein
MSALSHKVGILKRLHQEKAMLTATDFGFISNPNQYFVELENLGLIKSEWGLKGNARVKLRFIEPQQNPKVVKYLKSFGVIEDNQDEVQESQN